MPEIIQVPIRGLKELIDTMKGFPSKVLVNIVKIGENNGARVYRDEFRRLAPVLNSSKKHGGHMDPPGFLKKNIKIGPLLARNLNAGEIGFRIGINKKAFYGRLVEIGHRIGKKGKKLIRKKAGNAETLFAVLSGQEFGTQEVPANPFMRPGFDAASDAALNAIVEGCRNKLESMNLADGLSSAESNLLNVVGQMLGEDEAA